MTAPSRLAPLLHLLAGTLLGLGLVGTFLLWKPDFAEQRQPEFHRVAFTTAVSWGVLGAVGGLLGGVAASLRPTAEATPTPGIRFWMTALGAGGTLTFGAVAARNVPSGDDGGPAVHIVAWLIVGWLAGVLLGAVGSAFARAVSPVMTAALRGTKSGLPETPALLLGAILGGALWAVFWGVLVALLALFAVGVVLLSVGTGGAGPALAVGGTCGCVFFGLRFVLLSGRGARA